MKRSARPFGPQLNLSLVDAPATTGAPETREKELTLALVELLLNAAQESPETQSNGEENERAEAHA